MFAKKWIPAKVNIRIDLFYNDINVGAKPMYYAYENRLLIIHRTSKEQVEKNVVAMNEFLEWMDF